MYLFAIQVYLSFILFYYSLCQVTLGLVVAMILLESTYVRISAINKDYTDTQSGFSVDVDEMLIKALRANSCPEQQNCVLLLLDEMHIRQQLVFDKHSGSISGYVNNSEIVNHLTEFEGNASY